MQKIELGKPFPGGYPKTEGAAFEVGPDGDMNLLIQHPNPSNAEAQALTAGFTRYSFFESSRSNLACWVWKFPAPVGYLDTPFHSGLYPDERCIRMADGNHNMLMVYVLDGPIVKGIRMVGLNHNAAAIFHATIKKQQNISTQEYNAAVDWLQRMEPKQIYEAGKQFMHAAEA